ncbi:MAG: benzoate/H(+) symporter BenE family transporter [Pseudomonadota bacterium]
MRLSIVTSALVAVLVGFGGSVAVVLSAAEAVGATAAETSSWIAMLCVSMMATSLVLSWHHRMPIVTAWSTPGAALIATGTGVGLAEAVGAFVFCAALILLTALVGPLGRLVSRIPARIASAVLAGVLFPFVIGVVGAAEASPLVALPMVAVFLVVRLISPAWAVIAVLGLGIALCYGLGLVVPGEGFMLSRFVWVTPVFDPGTLISLGLPLYLVTMASQNLPGFAVLRADAYDVPSRSILGVTGLASLLTAGFGAHTTSLAAITASICTGQDAHPDPAKRWLCGPVYALGYGVLALGAASVVAYLAQFPPSLLVVIAGLALAGPLIQSLSASTVPGEDLFAPVATFIVTASGIAAFGLGSAFWGLVAGLVLTGLQRLLQAEKS